MHCESHMKCDEVLGITYVLTRLKDLEHLSWIPWSFLQESVSVLYTVTFGSLLKQSPFPPLHPCLFA